MKKIISVFASFAFLLIISCNNDNKTTGADSNGQKAKADSIYDEVDKDHMEGMSKMSTLSKLKKEAARLIDSLDKLPAKAKEASAPYKAKLESLAKDLGSATADMNTWMENFNVDSAKNDLAQRIKYLSEEKLRISKVKEAMNDGLAKADSLIKSKF